MSNHCFTSDLAFYRPKESERPESFLRRLLWKNSGVLCLATLITLPIIIGVAIGYVIVLAFVTTYRKITGKKSREEKESEAAKKFRIVLGNDLLDTAFTKPHELPAQKPKFIRRIQRYGSVNDGSSNITISSDENESEDESETQSEEEMIEQIDERTLKGSKSEKEELNKKVEACIENNEFDQRSYDDVIDTEPPADYDGSRTTSASSGRYSTASEMTDGRDSWGNDTLSSHHIAEYETQLQNTSGQNTYGNEVVVTASNDDHLKSSIEHTTLENKLSKETEPAVDCMKPDSVLSADKTAPMRNSEVKDSRLQTHKTVPAIPGVNQDSVHQLENLKAEQHDSSSWKSTHHTSSSVGKLKYSVHYMREKNELQVTIIKAINLFHEKNESPPSSFVKVSLLPQRFCWQKTKIVQETRNPIFNETFVISGFSHERFSNYTLLICVVNGVTPWQGFYGDHVIGELLVPLCNMAKYSSNQQKIFSQWADLKSRIKEIPSLSKCGKINLALCYRPISGRLIVTIKRAKDLECDSKERFDPYVKLALYCGGSRVGRGSTRVKRKVTSPVFNEKFNFNLSSEQITYTTIVVKIMNNVNNATSRCTGATVIGYESSGSGQEHWLCMMKCLSKHVDAWHTVYS